MKITVRKGITLKAKAIGPDGNVVPDVVGFCEGIDARLIEIRNNAQTFADGVFRLPGADPARTYRVYLLQSERRIGAAVDLKPDPQAKQPIEVKLQPTSKVHGKLVTAGGTSDATEQVYPLLVIRDKHEGEMSRDDIFRNMWFHRSSSPRESCRTMWNAQVERSGRVCHRHLVIGRSALHLRRAKTTSRPCVPVAPLEPGEDRDLGTITLKERKP